MYMLTRAQIEEALREGLCARHGAKRGAQLYEQLLTDR
jgi:hypothetical protein